MASWKNILAADFGLGSKWIETESNSWAERLKESVYGWRYASGDQINEELCNALLYASTLDYTPRADKERKTAPYNVRDVRLWVHLYRKTHVSIKDSKESVSTPEVTERVKYHIARLFNDGLFGEAWQVSERPDGVVHVYNDLVNRFDRPFVKYSAAEKSELDEFCRDIGFDKDSYLNSAIEAKRTC